MERFSDIPMFPLGIVLVPTETLPLHIFEPRYRDMIARCLERPEPFCVVYADDTGLRETGCLAVDIEVLERFDDGRLNIAVTGGDPVLVERVDDASYAYLTATGHTVDDVDEPAPAGDVDDALTAYRRLVETAEGGDGPPEPTRGPRLSYAIAGRIDFGADVKQALLEARSERARLADVTRLVRTATRSVAVARAVADRAHSNGKVVPAESLLDDDGDPR